MHEDATTSHLVLLDSIGDSHLVLGDEPHVTIDATVIGEVECHLLLAWRVVLIVAVVCADGDDKIIAYMMSRKGNSDGQVAAFMFFHLLAIDVDGLLTHNSLEVQRDVTTFALLGQTEVLSIPHNALVVATATGLSRHQLDGVGCGDHFPLLVIEVFLLCSWDVVTIEAPSSIKVPYQTSAVLQREEASDGGLELRRCLSIGNKSEKRQEGEYDCSFSVHGDRSYCGLL